MRRMIRRFLADDNGFTATEYAVLAMLVALMISAGARAIGTKLSANYFGPVAGNL